MPFPESAACGARIEQCDYTYEARVPRLSAASNIALSFNSSQPGAAHTTPSSVSEDLDTDGDLDMVSMQTTGGQQQQEAKPLVLQRVRRAAAGAAAATRLVANSVVERYVAEQDTGGHIAGDPASEQAREYLHRCG